MRPCPRRRLVLLRHASENGTTTPCVYCAVYPQSADALFDEAEKRNMRMIAGKCMMDRNVPEALRDTAQTGYDQSRR